jgi:hypothetical protein
MARSAADEGREGVDHLVERKVADAVNSPSSALAAMTTIVESRSSIRVGQLAFWSSPIISPTKMRVLWNGIFHGLLCGLS